MNLHSPAIIFKSDFSFSEHVTLGSILKLILSQEKCYLLVHKHDCFSFPKQASQPVIVTSQPARIPVTRVRVEPASDNFVTLSVVLTTIFLMCGCWYPLCCSIPAIFFAVSVSSKLPL